VLLFGSGACALIYQTVWLRQFRLIFGASTAASAAVLAIFMGGLGLGGIYIGKRVDRASNPLAIYGFLEVGVAIFAGLMLAGKRATIYGDGAQTRDYVYVDDVVDAFVRATEKGGGLLMNIGTGVETSVLDLFEAMARLTGHREMPRLAPARAGELQRSALDPGRAAIHLGWKPWTSLEEGLTRALDWFGSRDGD